MSLALYALIALRRDNVVATEAAMKYFVLGALASGFLLYGMSMVYGATGHLTWPKSPRSSPPARPRRWRWCSASCSWCRAWRSLGAVPFHMWVPDVYQGSPTAVTLILGGAPKLAAFAITLRLLVDGLHGLAADWQPMLMILAVLSLAIGNLTAIAQTNFKRMLAYSTISHMGFVLLGLMSARSPASRTRRLRLRRLAVLHADLRADHASQLRHCAAAVAPGFRVRAHRRPEGPEPPQPVACRHRAVADVLAGRHPAAGRLLCCWPCCRRWWARATSRWP